MSLQGLLWAGLGLSLVVTALEWRGRQRGAARQALSSIAGIAVYVAMLVGSAHPWLEGVSLAVGVVFLIYAVATTPQRIPWQSAPGIAFVVLAVLLALTAARPEALPPAAIKGLYALMALLVAWAAVSSWTVLKTSTRAHVSSR